MDKLTVFLDRDGVFCKLKLTGVRHAQDFEWLPGVPEAFARLNQPHIQTCLVTNQPHVGHLMALPRHVDQVHNYMVRVLEKAGGRLDHIEAAYAPAWLPHRRRKPRPGMLEDAKLWFAARGDQVGKAVMIGDNIKDAQAAAAFGCPAILLATTHSKSYLEEGLSRAGIDAQIVKDLAAAVDLILHKH